MKEAKRQRSKIINSAIRNESGGNNMKAIIRNKRGFTLIELMIVLAMIGILTAIAIPSYIAMLPHLRLRSSIRQLSSDLQLARVRAISENNDYRIDFNVATNDYDITKVGVGIVKDDVPFEMSIQYGYSAGAKGPPSTSDYVLSGNANASDGVSFTPNAVEFRPNGSANLQGSVYLTDADNSETYAITVLNTTGRIKVYRLAKGTVDNWPDY